MPSFLPENNTPLPTDDERRSWMKIASLASDTYGAGAHAPEPGDTTQILAHKIAASLHDHAS